jgi:sensor histidine kinase YesM
LEKVRYGDRLNIREEITGNPHNKLIAPLLMIPFLENCFKHGASAMRGKQWIELNINVTQHELDFRLSNSKPPGPVNQNGKKGIGLANVQKRLQLLYPEKHFLKMESEPDTFRVYLKVTLTEEAGLPLQETKYKKQQGAYYE